MKVEVGEIRKGRDQPVLGVLDALKRAPNAGGLPGNVAESLSGLMRHLAKS